MAKPSDIRHDPFMDVPTSITLTERHLIPSISPYTICLNEVPVKNSPTTTIVRIIDIGDGAVHYGADFDEVAATPIEGQFFPDYNTSAYDSTWNTGTIQFSAADAGKGVEVTYLAKGTLTGVSCNMYPSWWCDRGDGSDGDFYPTANVTLRGRYDFRSVYIPAGVTLYVAGFIDIRCQGMFINAGLINGDGSGGFGGKGGAGGIESLENGYGWRWHYPYTRGEASGGGAGGAGANNSEWTDTQVNGVRVTLDEGVVRHLMRSDIPCMGCGGTGGDGRLSSNSNNAHGGNGGRGGGCVQIVTAAYKNTGTISVRGTNGTPWTNGIITGSNPGGGGGGGCIKVICQRNHFAGNGYVDPGAGGGSGWYRIIELEASI